MSNTSFENELHSRVASVSLITSTSAKEDCHPINNKSGTTVSTRVASSPQQRGFNQASSNPTIDDGAAAMMPPPPPLPQSDSKMLFAPNTADRSEVESIDRTEVMTPPSPKPQQPPMPPRGNLGSDLGDGSVSVIIGLNYDNATTVCVQQGMVKEDDAPSNDELNGHPNDDDDDDYNNYDDDDDAEEGTNAISYKNGSSTDDRSLIGSVAATSAGKSTTDGATAERIRSRHRISAAVKSCDIPAMYSESFKNDDDDDSQINDDDDDDKGAKKTRLSPPFLSSKRGSGWGPRIGLRGGGETSVATNGTSGWGPPPAGQQVNNTS